MVHPVCLHLQDGQLEPPSAPCTRRHYSLQQDLPSEGTRCYTAASFFEFTVQTNRVAPNGQPDEIILEGIVLDYNSPANDTPGDKEDWAAQSKISALHILLPSSCHRFCNDAANGEASLPITRFRVSDSTMHLTNIGKLFRAGDIDILSAHGTLPDIIQAWHDNDLLDDPSVSTLFAQAPVPEKVTKRPNTLPPTC